MTPPHAHAADVSKLLLTSAPVLTPDRQTPNGQTPNGRTPNGQTSGSTTKPAGRRAADSRKRGGRATDEQRPSLLRSLLQCNFCRLDMKRLPLGRLRWLDRLLACCGLPIYQCPHCFGCARRPWIPEWLRGGSAKASAPLGSVSTSLDTVDDEESVTDGDCGPVTIPVAHPAARAADVTSAPVASTQPTRGPSQGCHSSCCATTTLGGTSRSQSDRPALQAALTNH